MGWNVVTLRIRPQAAGGLRAPRWRGAARWIDDCPNSSTRADLPGRRGLAQAVLADLGRVDGVRAIIDPLPNDELAALMNNLGGHDIETLSEAFRAGAAGDQPTCFIAYTIKGMGLPFAGHKDNHAGLMTKEQMEEFRSRHGHPPRP